MYSTIIINTMTRREDRATITAIIGVSSATGKERCSYQLLSKNIQSHNLTGQSSTISAFKQHSYSFGFYLSRLAVKTGPRPDTQGVLIHQGQIKTC